MPRIKLLGDEKVVAETWKQLVGIGPVSRVEPDYVYLVSQRHLEWLEHSQRPFEHVSGVAAGQSLVGAQLVGWTIVGRI